MTLKPMYKLNGIECELTNKVHLWITRDGVPLDLEEACADLNEMVEEVFKCRRLLWEEVDRDEGNRRER